jgi:hypothetical protein
VLGASSSTIAVNGSLTLGGTLNIASGSGFAAGDYTLFTYTGGLSGLPVLGTTPTGFEGYTYAVSTSTPQEVILEVSPPSSPSFSSASFDSSSGNIILSGTGGVKNGAYDVLTSTNVALPLSQWTPVATNQFNSSGSFVFTNSVQTGDSQRFFLLQIPEP